jgi:hypothetical protein
MAAPATAAGIKTLFDARSQATEGHQRMPALRLAEQPVQDHAG